MRKITQILTNEYYGYLRIRLKIAETHRSRDCTCIPERNGHNVWSSNVPYFSHSACLTCANDIDSQFVLKSHIHFSCCFLNINQENQVNTLICITKKYFVFHCFQSLCHLFAMKWWSQMLWSSLFECSVLSQLFHSYLSPSSSASLVPLHFLPSGSCHMHIWDYWYFPGNLDSSLLVIQPSISHDTLCIEVK